MPKEINPQKWTEYWERFKLTSTLRLYYDSVTKAMAENLNNTQGPIADIGCGNGYLTAMLARSLNTNIVAIDIVKQPLSQARFFSNKIIPIQASVYHLPFKKGVFGAIVSIGSASAATYNGAQPEVSRVLAKGGVLFVDFVKAPNIYQPRPVRPNYAEFQRNGLKLSKSIRLNTGLPVLPYRVAKYLDKILGRTLSPVLSRTILTIWTNGADQ